MELESRRSNIAAAAASKLASAQPPSSSVLYRPSAPTSTVPTPSTVGSLSAASSLPDLLMPQQPQSASASSRPSPSQSTFIVNPKHQMSRPEQRSAGAATTTGGNAVEKRNTTAAANRGRRGRGRRGRGRQRSDSTETAARPSRQSARAATGASGATQAAPPQRRGAGARSASVDDSHAGDENHSQMASVMDEEGSATDLDALFDSDISSPESGWDTDQGSQAANNAPDASEQAAKRLKVLTEEPSSLLEGKERRRRTAAAEPAHSRSFVNHDFCDSCQQGGVFVCCETCPRSFHFVCAEPPVDEENLSKVDHWYCKSCTANMNPPPRAPDGPFKLLIDSVRRMNPVSFSVPEEIRRYFEGVSWNASTGDYVDTREMKHARGRGADVDLFRVNGDEGDTILCHVCAKSALHGPIITCDFCPLSWHLDCLNPPMTHPLPPTKRWMCPAHAEYLMQKNRKIGRYQHYITLTDPALKNDGDIEVVLDEHFPPDPQIDRRRRITYKIPERSIKFKFLQKLGKIQPQLQPGKSTTATDDDDGPAMVEAPSHVLSLYEQAGASAKPMDALGSAGPTGDSQNASMVATADEAQTWLLGLSSFYAQVAQQFCPQLKEIHDVEVIHENMDTLYRAAMGEQPMEIAETAATTDPLFQQFTAWKELMRLQQKMNTASDTAPK